MLLLHNVLSGREMKVVSINGVELAAVHMETENECFQCARPVGWPEWGCENPVIVSGHIGGVVRFWRLVPEGQMKAGVAKQGAASHHQAQVRYLGVLCDLPHTVT